jgi:hypothetical protein
MVEKTSAKGRVRYVEETSGMSEQRAKPLAHVAPPDEAPSISTVRPPFDPLEFARDSESMIRIGEADPPSNRPTAPPPPGLPQYQAGLTSGMMHSLANVGPDTVPSLAMAGEDLAWFELPEPAASLLGHVDGATSIGVLSAHAGVGLDAAMATFHELARQGIVTLSR